MNAKLQEELAHHVAAAILGVINGPRVSGKIATLEAQLIALSKSLVDTQTELNYVKWAREQEAEKVPR